MHLSLLLPYQITWGWILQGVEHLLEDAAYGELRVFSTFLKVPLRTGSSQPEALVLFSHLIGMEKKEYTIALSGDCPH